MTTNEEGSERYTRCWYRNGDDALCIEGPGIDIAPAGWVAGTPQEAARHVEVRYRRIVASHEPEQQLWRVIPDIDAVHEGIERGEVSNP